MHSAQLMRFSHIPRFSSGIATKKRDVPPFYIITSEVDIPAGDATDNVPSGFRAHLRRRRVGGFSLVEVTMAIGIVSFAFLTILGLIPTGLKTFRSAIDASVSGQIFQRVMNEAQQTDFATLVGSSPAIRYFDDQGNECIDSKAIYHVNTRVIPTTELTSTGTCPSNDNIATVTVQIVNNPANTTLPMANNLWTVQLGTTILTHSMMVARNK